MFELAGEDNTTFWEKVEIYATPSTHRTSAMPVTLSCDDATPVTLLSDGVTSASHFGEGETNKGLPFRIGCAVARFKRGATYQETSKISSSDTWFRRNRYYNKYLLLQAWIW